ncbi:PulJ/GspJ family protein [Nocardioides jiangxiensis]|uniref:Prepilin-type N-terminal cleavage/methylation domain-containing protein n=1 Tax=Nocardioides jiangxiensis TaxID=3064524 RepID=A0ABT9B2A2_9ACTN|nr:prepilin-type N-terminal cleavage/methylation domain-containing protein [Nocardioides sp. WY-20]MDO7867406.1 prepilin-type N-terminal cleavage/methylation domain-containing protein [Nocardioides sp. WY-20]
MRTLRRVLQRRRPDEGFTLIELVMAVSILGIITVALTGVVLEYLKVSTSTRTRLTESTDQQFISAYWQQDVSSLGRRSFAPANVADPVPVSASVFVGGGSPGNCGAGVGAVVVAFSWTDFTVNAANPDDAWNSTLQEAAWVRRGPTELVRVRCSGGTAGAPIRVARNLDGAPTVTCVPSCTPGGTLPRTVSMQFNVRDTSEPTADTHYVTTVTADRRQG